MFDLIIGLITGTYGKQIVIGIIIALLLIIGGLGVTLWVQNARLDAANARYNTIGDKLAIQNSAVNKWRAEAEKQKSKVQSAAKKAEKIKVVTIERIEFITKTPVPASCPEAVRWGAERAMEFNTRWENGNAEFGMRNAE